MRKLKQKNYPIPFRGGELSIQANEGAYCTPRSDYGPYSSVEVAHINEVGDMILIERIQDIQPVDSNTILRVVRGVAVPAIMIVVRPLFGM